MIKLIKKNGLGGIANSVDSALDGLGTWGKLGVQIIDPTGITSWKDFGDSLKAFQKEGTLLKAGEMGLSALGTIPMFGMFKGLPKLLGIVKKADKASDATKLIKKVKDLPKSIDVATYKKLLDPNFNSKAIIEDLDLEDLTKLKGCIELSASKYIKEVGANTASPELVKKARKYEELLTDIDKTIYQKQLDSLYRESEPIIATQYHSFSVNPRSGNIQAEIHPKLTTKAGRAELEKLDKAKKQYLSENSIIYFD